jgi:hypothetical protein
MLAEGVGFEPTEFLYEIKDCELLGEKVTEK